jgi:selenocysteine-specific elongation factor
MATVALLEGDRIEPGGWGLAQLFLAGPAVAAWGQPFVLREAEATHTLGGGQVLQPAARKVRRRHREVIDRVARLAGPDAERRALACARLAGAAGVTAADLVRGAGVAPGEAAEMLRRCGQRGELVALGGGPGRAEALVHADVVREAEERVAAALARLHGQAPLLPAVERQKLQAGLADLGEALVDLAVGRLLDQGRVVGDRQRLARADFRPKLGGGLLRLKEEVLAAYRGAGLRPPRPKDFVRRAGGHAASLDDLFALCVAEGQLVHIKEDIYLHRDAEARMRTVVVTTLAGSPGLTAAQIRDRLGTSRLYTIALCEYLDRLGVTRREGDLRVLAR